MVQRDGSGDGVEDPSGPSRDDEAIVLSPLYGDFKHVAEGDGIEHIVSQDGVLSVVGGRAFTRSAKKVGAQDGVLQSHIRVLVGELNGVRCYVIGTQVILTEQDMYF